MALYLGESVGDLLIVTLNKSVVMVIVHQRLTDRFRTQCGGSSPGDHPTRALRVSIITCILHHSLSI